MREIVEDTLSAEVKEKVHSYHQTPDNTAQYDGSHDSSHIERVVALAYEIGRAEQTKTKAFAELNWNLIDLAARFHDVGDKKYVKDGEDGKTLAKRTMLGLGVEEATAQAAQTIINNVSYSHEVQHPESVQQALRDYPELAIVQDADRLDALGAVGIGRAFTYGGARGRPMGETVQHFREKLEQLEGMMKTATGKAMARKRVERLQQFQAWWTEETKSSVS